MRKLLLLPVFLAACRAAPPTPSPRQAPRWVAEVFVLHPTPLEPGLVSGAAVPGGPFAGQPVQGFSALALDRDGGLLTVTDNGYGAMANSADFQPGVFALSLQAGALEPTLRFHFRDEGGRALTGADFDPESLVVAPDGTFWVGDEFGPSLMHFDATGRRLGVFRVPDVTSLDAPEQSRLLHTMLAVRQQTGTRIASPQHTLLDVAQRVQDLHVAGFTVIPWTVNEPERMRELVAFGVDGLISDRPDLALALDAGIDVQGHRGARGLRPENTLPAFEVALELGTPTLELDLQRAADGGTVVWHDPQLTSEKCHGPAKPLTLATATPKDLQAWRCDVLQARFPEQRALAGPVSTRWARSHRVNPFTPVTFAQLLSFLDAWLAAHPQATPPRLNLETKGTTAEDVLAVRASLLSTLAGTRWQARSTLQSFVFDSLAPGPLPTVALLEGAAPPPARIGRSAGFENLAMTPDGRTLLAMLEKPDGPARELRAFSFDLATEQFTGLAFRFPLHERAVGIADIALLSDTEGLALERDDSEGTADGYKRLLQFTRPAEPGGLVTRSDLVDLLALHTTDGAPFAFPFITIEGVLRLPDGRIAVVADNNFPFGRARHPGTDTPDDTELIVLHEEK